ncbi:unnamed protein product [Caenorhabditis angaria]|uniref:Uncharacterized protein n=1 Tax=Caenorhabditis angaria TaxID=860376 RepID=A0A9P1IE51_9PELO|nr:unnamed protein product [Caenorhabditis angaria]
MSDKPARRIVDGRIGDQFHVAMRYGGKFEHAIGVPVQTPRAPAQGYPVPPGPADITYMHRPEGPPRKK